MTSLAAGSPACNCKNPDTCIHSFTLQVKEHRFTYKQNGFVSVVETIDTPPAGVPISLSLTGKTCVSGNPECPQGMIYDEEKGSSLMSFNQGTTAYTAHYNSDNHSALASCEGIEFINQYILGREPMKHLTPTPYILRVGQCQGNDFVNKPLTFTDGVSQILGMAPVDSLWTVVNVYPTLSWTTELTIEFSESTKEYSDAERKKQQRKKNASEGNAQRGVRSWTRLPQHKITQGLDIGGEFSYKINGQGNPHSVELLKKEFKKNPDKLSILNKAEASLTRFNELFTGTQNQEGTVSILTAEILYPGVKISGGGELKENDVSGAPYMEYQVSVVMGPLIGMKVTFDLIQAFAAWYKVDILMAAVREKLMSGQQAVEEGKNGAFAGTKFNLIAQAEVDLGIQVTSDAEGNWEWAATGVSEIKGSLILDVHVQAGARFYVVNGVLDIEASATAELMVGLDTSKKDRVDMVLYHNGITAEIHASFTGGIALNKGVLNNNENLIDDITDNENIEKSKSIDRSWIIYDKLEKENSVHRINIM
ncbi:hypothetical protein LG71_07995 [Pluralibacter gergoviae]|uniref:hypothetical protein n=1 Tax=Pluralibacter gergoviae TaxID=61647 RepID=UPI0004F6FCC0|nr:hypothetical protein [Pluralibacter gergoviae]AIQ99837.1 hypothetical protein LG71_07995 [Pluralibacter gergoviae]